MEFILTFLLIVFLTGWLLARVLPRLLLWWVQRRMRKGGGSFDRSFGGPFFGGTFFGNGFGPGTGPAEGSGKQASGSFCRASEPSSESDGRVTVSRVEASEKIIEEDMGEYVDFEEEPSDPENR